VDAARRVEHHELEEEERDVVADFDGRLRGIQSACDS
jgi:hypothetical protein